MKSQVVTGLALAGALLFIKPATKVFADDYDKKTDVTISEPVEVPGGVVLQPGTYMFRLMDITGNRHVVQIRSEDGKKTYAIAMVAAAHRTEPTSKVVLSFYEMPSGQPPAVHKWFWPGDVDGQEFLYPHKRAAEITKVSKETVQEASEDVAANAAPADNAPVADKTTSAPVADNSSTAVAVDTTVAAAAPAPAPEPTPAPAAAVAVETPAPAPEQNQTQLLAQANTPAPSVNDQPSPAAAPAPSANDTTSLPQTASDLPLLALMGGLSLAGALVVRRVRA